jgi:glutamine amidotransferase-like uncharacterized protein
MTPSRLRYVFALGLLLSVAPFSFAQDSLDEMANVPEVTELPKQKVDPKAINDFKSVFAFPPKTRPLNVAIYEGKGSPEGGIKNVSDRLMLIPGTKITRLSAEEIGQNNLTTYDLVVFSGGLSNTQAKYIGPEGKENIRNYVAGGGNYLGVCAGAYLACAGFEWGIGILNAQTISPKWFRGLGYLKLELSDEGRGVIQNVKEPFTCRYNSGPIIKKLNRPDLPDYTVLAWFREEKIANASQAGTMVNTPAIVMAPYGKGRVLAISPHPENSAGLENLIPRAVLTVVSR